MSEDRVLTTAEAKSAIGQIRSIIDNGLSEQIQQLENQGQILSDPSKWDGRLASQFRADTWPTTSKALASAKHQLDDLHSQLSKISQNIMAAGGNA